jgi:hypothetical protein
MPEQRHGNRPRKYITIPNYDTCNKGFGPTNYWRGPV